MERKPFIKISNSFMVLKIAQITDTHLFADRTTAMRGLVTWDSFGDVVAEVKAWNPDILLLTGDLTHRGEPQAYQHLIERIAPLNRPTYYIPGNHDDVDILNQEFKNSPFLADKVFQDKGWQVLLLDSTLATAQSGEGYLSEAQLKALEQSLIASSEPTVVVLHHHPVPMGIDWLDTIGVQNHQAFLDCLTRFPQVKLVLFGHVHLEFDEPYQGIQFCGSPSTCKQVLRDGASEEEAYPGFRGLRLFEDGTYQTEVIRSHPRQSL